MFVGSNWRISGRGARKCGDRKCGDRGGARADSSVFELGESQVRQGRPLRFEELRRIRAAKTQELLEVPHEIFLTLRLDVVGIDEPHPLDRGLGRVHDDSRRDLPEDQEAAGEQCAGTPQPGPAMKGDRAFDLRSQEALAQQERRAGVGDPHVGHRKVDQLGEVS